MRDMEPLFRIAETQEGLFTYQQARAAGYPRKFCIYHVKNGDWIREAEGLYRINLFPWSEHQEFVKWYLWSRNKHGEPQGVFSRVTALHLHRFSDVSPMKIHMTVPLDFKRRKAPSDVVELHFENLYPQDIETRNSVKVTTIEKAVIDLVADGYSRDILKQVIAEAFDEGRLNTSRFLKMKDSSLEAEVWKLIEEAPKSWT